MGRYPNIAASKAKTGAAKGKLYSMYAKEIYQAAKTGGASLDANASLKRLVDKAKKEQVPNDIINRAIDKVNSGIDESYEQTRYEIFGPGGSTVIADCLTDNLNRTVSDIRTVLNKTHTKMGAMNSVSYMYDNICMVGFKGLNEEDTLDILIESDVEALDIYTEDGITVVTGNPTDLFAIKEVIANKIPDVNFEYDELTTIAKDKIRLTGEDLEVFNKLINMLEEVEDINHIYHNVDLD